MIAASPCAQRVAPRFGIDPATLVSLGAFESEVLAGETPQGSVVLKVIAPEHRTPAEVAGEVAWLLALAAAGVRVARPLPTLAGEPFALDGEGPHVAVAFERAPGRHVPAAEWTRELHFAQGALLGQMHAHARSWTPPPGFRRRGWLERDVLADAARALPGDAAFAAGVAATLARVQRSVPGGDAHVGVIHADLHPWNVLVDEDRLCAIDFDDAVIGPYLHDLTIPLYYAVAARPDIDPAEAAEAFLEPYLAGFDRFAPRPPGDADAVAALLALRQADLATFLHLNVPPERRDAHLRAAAVRLRDRTAQGYELVPRSVLARHFGG